MILIAPPLTLPTWAATVCVSQTPFSMLSGCQEDASRQIDGRRPQCEQRPKCYQQQVLVLQELCPQLQELDRPGAITILTAPVLVLPTWVARVSIL